MKAISVAAIMLLAGSAASAQTTEELNNDGKNTDNVLTYGMGYHQQRYSRLNQINKNTVKRLVPVWSLSLDNQWGEQAQPMIHNGVMYVTNARHTVAIDVVTGKQIWRHTLEWPAETPRVVCCGVSNKGAAIFDGKVFRTTLDAHVIALDAKTGKEVWKVKVDEWKDGFSMTMAPLIANGVLITGMSGAEFGIRGYIDGWDPQTGKRLWRTYTIPARGEKHNDTWPQDNDAWKVGGGSSWITGSYDPELDLTYWGTGNPAPWASQSRKGDNLYTSSVIAMRPKTGEIVWHYQFTPNDPYDFDANWELINADIEVGGQKRKVLMQLNRNGFLYVLDRTNGKLISASAYEKVNWADPCRPGDRPPDRDRRRRKGAQHGNDRDVAVDARRQELAARRIQSRDRPPLRQYDAPRRNLPAHRNQAACVGSALPVHREQADSDRRGCRNRPRRCDRAVDRQAALASAASRPPALVGHARNRRRTLVHRQDDRRVHRDRQRHRQDRLAVPDRVGRQRTAGNVHAGRPAIRDDPVGCRRLVVECGAPATAQRAAGRIGLDLCPD